MVAYHSKKNPDVVVEGLRKGYEVKSYSSFESILIDSDKPGRILIYTNVALIAGGKIEIKFNQFAASAVDAKDVSLFKKLLECRKKPWEYNIGQDWKYPYPCLILM